MANQRIKGQELSIRIVQDGNLLAQLDSVASFDDKVDLEMKQDGFLGESVNRFDEILNGYGFSGEMQVTDSSWNAWQQAIIDRATRKTPGTVFNIVRTDLFPNGTSNVYTYADVHWGNQPTTVGSRGDYLKVKFDGGCSTRNVQTNQI